MITDRPWMNRGCDICLKPSTHSVFQSGLTTLYCCRCHVNAGFAPADWHPDCMSTYKEKTMITNLKGIYELLKRGASRPLSINPCT
jgi:pyruvate formate-lyase activating enzyme-like uncharacterized protein